MTRALALAAALCALAAPTATAAAAPLPPVKHVFIVVLENKDYSDTFGAETKAPYLAHELAGKGQILTQYYGTSHESLGNYITMVSGQAANPETQADCIAGFNDIFPGVVTPDYGQVFGAGCVYPRQTQTVVDQMERQGISWKGYMQDMGTPCRHPAIGEIDPTQKARVGDQYAVRHNPFVYFHSIIDERARCAAHVVDLKELGTDLQRAETTPAYAFITPGLCDDGHDEPCVDGRPGGLVSADAFLKTWAPRILDSPAFDEGGLLIVTWDEADGETDAQHCCGETPGPSSPLPGIFGLGGGRTGTVVVSPWTKPGTQNATPYNHYSLLRTVEDLFGLPHLGYAARGDLSSFGSDVFDTAPPSCATSVRRHGRTLVIRPAHRSTVRVRVRRGAKVRTARVGACQQLRVALPRHGAGRARVSVAGEKRAVRYG